MELGGIGERQLDEGACPLHGRSVRSRGWTARDGGVRPRRRDAGDTDDPQRRHFPHQRARDRLHRSGARSQRRSVPHRDLREPDALCRRAAPGRPAVGPGGGRGLPARLTRREDFHLHDPKGLPLQHRRACNRGQLRAGDQPRPQPGDEFTLDPVRSRHRRRRGRAPREDDQRSGGPGRRQQAGHQADRACAGSARSDDAQQLLLRSGESARRSGRCPCPSACRRALLHRGLRARSKARSPEEPLLPRSSPASRRRLLDDLRRQRAHGVPDGRPGTSGLRRRGTGVGLCRAAREVQAESRSSSGDRGTASAW